MVSAQHANRMFARASTLTNLGLAPGRPCRRGTSTVPQSACRSVPRRRSSSLPIRISRLLTVFHPPNRSRRALHCTILSRSTTTSCIIDSSDRLFLPRPPSLCASYSVHTSSRAMFGFSSKRRREHGDLADVDYNASHERKKFCPLALRSSPNTAQKPSFAEAHQVASRIGLSTITPVESSDEEDGDNGYSATNRLSRSTAQSHSLRTGMEIDSGEESFPSAWTAAANHDGGIQPSPIPNNMINQSLTISERHDSMDTRNPLAPARRDEPTPEKIHDPAPWQDQRLPSPVSESEDGFPSSINSVSDTDMNYNISHAASSPADATSSWQSSAGLHARPDHVTKPRNKKITFSMGFRADCEKCHRKVPGHYSHIIRA
ncbi:hypothetical protein P170DRAFT_11931 [Aspergillus steynii IBT 23096]|uniref:Uncharacterized protein n=1 Tax=Aspergillus steynii IBT 23096 TaxID=1392250 RepID=A0A2I2GN18_9EURO|nr:uncharacterized protein P170DRAFT_11931 [Aspergillus steynii IBT 23096]PLB54266.1 hypothetical protein P170DRAFT_11931 [Aspergillus steynii IBT 23096]